MKPKLVNYTKECLESRRWNGNVVQMLVDASITSLGMSYFGVIVPKVREFPRAFPEINSLKALADANTEKLRGFFKNKRSWHVAQSVAAVLMKYGSGVSALRKWASQADHHSWRNDEIGQINGVGINTFQYLRMMGGVNTIMPDGIVKRYIAREYGLEWSDDIDFIDKVHEMQAGYSPIELCWLSWLVESKEIDKEF
ncbi:MAG: hypothetical protein J4432_01240 [DPANN group archaeon]|nr:hypothetical protein [DPANN group archaeon]